MRFKNNFFNNYLKEAPLPLALERSFECEILSKQKFIHPILDIGCGEGLFATILFNEKIDVGIDPDEKELKRAKDFNMYTELIKCFGNKIPKESCSFNTIFSNSVLEHIPDIEAVLKEAYRLLAADGNFYITVPTDRFDQYSVVNQLLKVLGLKKASLNFRKFFNSFWKHYHYYDLSGWKNLAERNGFKVVEMKEYESKSICLLNDFMTPFSVPSLIIKKIFNKWTLFPSVRTITLFPVRLFIRHSLFTRNIGIKEGGLIFIHLRK
jgi:SAM-dependent methyltransferase